MNAREWAQSERHALCDLMDELGADAPTLCEGWTVAHMAAHLVVRERRPDTGPGLVMAGAPARHTARVTNRLAECGDFTQMVDRVRRGPPLFLRFADGAMNLVEFVVHHEDVRRTGDGWSPRTGIEGLEALLWERLGKGAKVMCRRLVDIDLTIARRGGETIRVGKSGRPATLTGEPVELVNFLFGRRDRVEVEMVGDEGACRVLRTGRLGI